MSWLQQSLWQHPKLRLLHLSCLFLNIPYITCSLPSDTNISFLPVYYEWVRWSSLCIRDDKQQWLGLVWLWARFSPHFLCGAQILNKFYLDTHTHTHIHTHTHTHTLLFLLSLLLYINSMLQTQVVLERNYVNWTNLRWVKHLFGEEFSTITNFSIFFSV